MSLGKREIDIGINDADRKKIAEGLSKLLADTYTLYLNTHNFHWNVTGPMFNTLHLMFMDQYTELWNSVDVIAERIRALINLQLDRIKIFLHTHQLMMRLQIHQKQKR